MQYAQKRIPRTAPCRSQPEDKREEEKASPNHCPKATRRRVERSEASDIYMLGERDATTNDR
ncbi:hypothetical protein HOY82DRAFT_490187 [Tuber indicum]|nr:hypothetical protein HOY82DRAFT_490187 [Tuber indicum]